MSAILEWFGPLSVTGRAVVGVATVLVILAALVILTALLTGVRRSVAIWTGLIVVALAGLVLMPVGTAGLTAVPRPAASYEEAVARFEALGKSETEALNPLCEPGLLDHGERTEMVVVLLHGVSSCPQAFVDFAPLLHERGHTVLALRMPQNGHADRATDALRHLTAEKLKEFGDDAVDIAAGLGEDVVVLGISAGGTVAGWTAQTRPEVDRAVLVAPFYGLGSLGPRINAVLMRAMLLMPDISIWKDPVARETYEGTMPHAYKRQSTNATAEIMRLGTVTLRAARATAPAAGQIVVVTNDADAAVSNATTDVLVNAWMARGADVVRYVFDAAHGLGHEIIDPKEPGADPALTYPVLVRLIEDPSHPELEAMAQRQGDRLSRTRPGDDGDGARGTPAGEAL